MHAYTVVNISNGVVLADQVRMADSFWTRARGLLGCKGLAEGEALVLSPCGSVHTMFMSFALDVLFLGRDGEVLKAVRNLPPWRSAACRGAVRTIELPAGVIERSGLTIGDTIDVVPSR